MFATERQERILQQVRRVGRVRVADLVDQLAVSDMTVRRDIASLAERGLVNRVHGGATAVAARSPGAAAAGRTASTPASAARSRMSTLAASQVEPGSTVALSGGSMAVELASALREIPALTVVTNSLSAADVLHSTGRDDLTVVLTGGQRTENGCLVGPLAVAGLRDLHADWAILGAWGMHEQAGLTVPTLAEAETDRAIMGAGARVMFVVESSRWQTVSLRTVAALDEIDLLVSDSGLRPATLQILETSVGRLLLAPA